MGFLSTYNNEFRTLQTVKGSLNIHKTLDNLSPELKQFCLDTNLSLKAAFYLWKNDYDKIPVCNVCGKPVIFDGKRFHNYCSKECQSKDRKSATQKMKETNLLRYGSTCSLNNEDVRAKAKETLKRNYGVEVPAQSDTVRDKMKSTSLEKYGVDNPAKNEKVKNKIAETNLERYGNICSLQSEENLEKKRQTMIQKYGDESFRNNLKREQTTLNRYGVKCVLQLPNVIETIKESKASNIAEFEKQNNVVECSKLMETYKGRWLDVITPVRFKNRLFIRISDIPKIEQWCENSKSLRTSNEEQDLFDFVRSIYSGVIIKNDRQIIKPKEIDIYIPEKKVGIEFDGLFWHSDYHLKEQDLHLQKTIMCEQQGIRLMHIFEDEWLQKPEIIKSMIKSALGIYDKKYYARKLKLYKPTFQEAKEFFTHNHIQGYSAASYYLALKDGDTIVQCVSIGKNRFKKNKDFELIRMASLLNVQVEGGFSRLIKNALKDLNISSIESYVDRRLFSGNGYKSSGWTVIGESKPRYFYTDFERRFNRLMFTKEECLKRWSKYGPEMTEIEMCREHRLYRIYDCGTIKMSYSKQTCVVQNHTS